MVAFARLVRGIRDVQITNTLQSIGEHGRRALLEVFGRRLDASDLDFKTPASDSGPQAKPVTQILRYTGAPQSIVKFNISALVQMARKADAFIEMDCAVGDTVVYDTQILQVRGAAHPLPEAELLDTVSLATQRTFEQDPKLPIRLLVDIAIKALSPAVNDPTTAVQAIDQLEDILRRLGQRALDDVRVRDDDGIVRLTYATPNWEDFLRLSFDEIRLYGANSVQVIRRCDQRWLALPNQSMTRNESSRSSDILNSLIYPSRGRSMSKTARLRANRTGKAWAFLAAAQRSSI
jgi:uncharacterized membrane protein